MPNSANAANAKYVDVSSRALKRPSRISLSPERGGRLEQAWPASLWTSPLFSECVSPSKVDSLCRLVGRLRKGHTQRWRIVNHFCRKSIRASWLGWLQHHSATLIGGTFIVQHRWLSTVGVTLLKDEDSSA